MTATNHAITGAVIAGSITNPWIALPAAFLSHFVLDGIPHYGNPNHSTSKHFKLMVLIDAVLAAAVMLAVVVAMPANGWLMVTGALAAMSPDLMWLPYWLKELFGKRQQHDPLGSLARIHKRIQWGERPWGLRIEVPYFIFVLFFFQKLLAA